MLSTINISCAIIIIIIEFCLKTFLQLLLNVVKNILIEYYKLKICRYPILVLGQ